MTRPPARNRKERRKGARQAVAPPDVPSLSALLAEAELLARQGEIERAAALAERVVHANPRLAAAWHMKGVLALSAGDAAAAVAALERAATIAPGDPAITSNLGIAQQRAGDPGGARTTFEALVRTVPDFAPARLNLAILLRDAGESEAAIVALREAVRLDAGYAKAWLELGRLLAERGEYEEALSSLARAGDSAEVQLVRGFCLQEQGRVDEAIRTYRHVLRRDPSLYPVVERNLTTASKGRLWLRPGAMRAALLESG